MYPTHGAHARIGVRVHTNVAMMTLRSQLTDCIGLILGSLFESSLRGHASSQSTARRLYSAPMTVTQRPATRAVLARAHKASVHSARQARSASSEGQAAAYRWGSAHTGNILQRQRHMYPTSTIPGISAAQMEPSNVAYCEPQVHGSVGAAIVADQFGEVSATNPGHLPLHAQAAFPRDMISKRPKAAARRA